jgi:hypothetical protein
VVLESGIYRKELILNISVFVVMVWGWEYLEELILNITVFVVRFWGGQYREELILNVTLFIVSVWGGQYRGDLIRNDSMFVVGSAESIWCNYGWWQYINFLLNNKTIHFALFL